MKKTQRALALKTRSVYKLLLLMKFTIALLLFTSWQVSAKTFSQERITLKLQSAELKTALKQIEKKSVYRFLYNDFVVSANRKVSIDASNALVTDVLSNMLNQTPLTFKVLENNLIVITQKDFVLNETRVTGKVRGAGGEPIPAVTVKIKGSTVATATDVNGNYSITVPDGATLVFSSIGYVTQEVLVSGRSEINVTLQITAKDINEVVVIGYGQASKRDLTGSIVKISGKEVADKPNTNPVASLQSKVAGLYIVNNGTPGAAPDIRIRGTVSIGQVNPLYIVDGILNDNIDYLNPNDIESIEILKDPSSLAIFGVRGATGAIAITTRKAKAGQTVINFNTTYGFKKLVDKIEMADASLFNTLFAEENANNNVATPDYSALKGNTDWIDAVTRTGRFNANNLSISGSTDKNKFNIGLGYITDEGIIKHERLEKMLLSFNDEYKVNNAIKLGINLNASRQQSPYNATGVLDNARKTMPHIEATPQTFKVKDPYSADSINMPIYSDVNRALQNSGVINPLLEVENTWNKTITYEHRYVGSFYVDVNFLKNFNFRPTWYADVSSVDSRSYSPLYYAYNPMNNTPYLYNTRTSVNQSKQDWKKYQQDYILTYKKKFGDHNLTAMAGFSTYYFGTSRISGTSSQGSAVTDLPIPNNPRLWYLNNGFGYVLQGGATSYQSEYSTVSVLARALYNYKNKYFLNASFRDDASSRIPEKNRHQKFWSVGAAWEISKEDFMQDITLIDYLKIKGSVGVLGNQSTYGLVGDYPSYPGLRGGTIVPFGSTLVTGALPAYRYNPNLKWETVNAAEIGFELNAFSNRLHFEYNYYSKKTSDMMTYVSLGALGLDDQLENGGEIKNWGHEFSATWTQKLGKDITLNLGGNITFMKNEVLGVAESLPGGVIIRGFQNNGSAEARTAPGYAIGSFYGYVVEGLYQSKLDILQSPLASSLGSYGPGDFKFKDVNGDGVIDANDRTFIGNPSPDFIYGGSIGLNYKRLNIGVDFGGVYGNEVFRTWGSLESPFQRVNYPAFKEQRWHGAGTSNWEPIISQAHRFNYNGSTYNIEDGSYFRIRNLQVGYELGGQKWLSSAKIRSLRLFANVQNLKTWKKTKGYTAEYGGDATAFGFDNAGGAIPRVTTFGLNVTF
jgi:TonB-linked SusC/RagA family outer membrane protein